MLKKSVIFSNILPGLNYIISHLILMNTLQTFAAVSGEGYDNVDSAIRFQIHLVSKIMIVREGGWGKVEVNPK